MVDRSTVLKLEEIDERAGVDESVFYRDKAPIVPFHGITSQYN